MQNPLLEEFQDAFQSAPFNLIKEDHYLPAFQEAILEAKKEISAITENQEKPTFENTIVSLERSGERINIISAIFFNLNHAATSENLQKLAQEISPLLTEYGNDVLLDVKLFERVKQVYLEKDLLNLSVEENTLLDHTYKRFARNGANLDESQKQRLREIDKEAALLSLKFGENVLAETNLYQLLIADEKDLEGLPADIIEMAKTTAKEKGFENQWLFTLHFPSYQPFMSYAKNRTLREKLYKAFVSKCLKNDALDNQDNVKKIAQLRHDRANLLGYASHADFILEERMAEKPGKVVDFLQNLLEKAKPFAMKEMVEIKEYAEKTEGIKDFERWDFAYFAEKLKKEKFSIDDELLKPYFKLENVIEGVFKVAEKLYGLQFNEIKEVPVYDSEVKVYQVLDEQNQFVSLFYADFFARENKKAGAWMTSFRGQKVNEKNKNERPHISIVCNFSKPTESRPSLLNLQEVLTFFHEFGHALHGMLANGKYESLSGTNVYWDFVELPSQVMENWVYEKECLDLFARHFETNEPIPQDLIQKIKESANFLDGYQTLRQLSFALLDMAWHSRNPNEVKDVVKFERNAILSTELLPIVKEGGISTSFSHIFQGGYSAGYYSYKWAEVLDADAFEYFKEKGIFNREVANSFRENILSKGGSEAPMELYKRFRGKEPQVESLLKRSGLIQVNSMKKANTIFQAISFFLLDLFFIK